MQPHQSPLTFVPSHSSVAQPCFDLRGGAPLYGHYWQSRDATGDVPLPHAFRASIGTAGVLTRSPQGSLWLFAVPMWQQMLDRLWATTLHSDPGQRTRRMLCAGAQRIELARDGSLALPPQLCASAAISDTIVFVGMYTYIEVWAAHRWAQIVQADVA